MEDDEDGLRFSSGDEMRRAAENRFGRSLSPEDWQSIDPDGWSGLPHSAYGEADLEELLQLMAQLPARPGPPTLDRQRAQALAHRQRTAVEAKVSRANCQEEAMGRSMANPSDTRLKRNVRAK